jgi:undecaprenyl pyrophosphate phosphatase UppP
MILLNAASDRMRSRGIFVVIVFTISAVGWIVLLAVVKNQHARYFACFCITIGGYAAIPLLMSWQCTYTPLPHKPINRTVLL